MTSIVNCSCLSSPRRSLSFDDFWISCAHKLFSWKSMPNSYVRSHCRIPLAHGIRSLTPTYRPTIPIIHRQVTNISFLFILILLVEQGVINRLGIMGYFVREFCSAFEAEVTKWSFPAPVTSQVQFPWLTILVNNTPCIRCSPFLFRKLAVETLPKAQGGISYDELHTTSRKGNKKARKKFVLMKTFLTVFCEENVTSTIRGNTSRRRNRWY